MAARSIAVEAYRIFDYFLLFPFDIGILRLRGATHKRLATKYELSRPYKWTADAGSTLLNMREFQDIALKTLTVKRVIDPILYDRGDLRYQGDGLLSDEMRADASAFVASRSDVFDFLMEVISQHGVTGPNGLKARSDLLPFKYDVKSDVALD